MAEFIYCYFLLTCITCELPIIHLNGGCIIFSKIYSWCVGGQEEEEEEKSSMIHFNLATFLNVVSWVLQEVSLHDATWHTMTVEDKWKSSWKTSLLGACPSM